MKRITRKDTILFLMQVAAWAIVLLLPTLAVFVLTQKWENAIATLTMLAYMLRGPIIVYFVNFYLLEPYLWHRKRRSLFVVSNILLVCLANYWMFMIDFSKFPMEGEMAYIGFFMGYFIYLLFHFAIIALAVGLRNYMRSRRLKEQLKEQQQKHTEAELAWLKNQINPHFLFNTLNNISSLIQIDPDTAQDSIAQLSDLLRYAMYETDKPFVPLKGEIEFMQNYIDLMRLRHNDKLKLTTEWPVVPPSTLHLPPLLFISLIENAFKHGVSSNRPSLINIRLTTDGDTLSFTCQNTNYPKDDQNRSGSGIGLENTRRRLELMYPDRYTWDYGINNDGTEYHSCITIDCKS
jgi:LytS/YehU family sensor histidine kinase